MGSSRTTLRRDGEKGKGRVSTTGKKKRREARTKKRRDLVPGSAPTVKREAAGVSEA